MEYKAGEYLVHETSGVCQISDIEDMELMGKGSLKTYYIMTPVFKPTAKVFTPVSGSSIRLRPVASRQRFKDIIEGIGSIEIINESNDRLRQERFKELLAEFTPEALAILVKTVLIRMWARAESGKKTMASDEKSLAVAGKKLYEEMAFSMNMDIADVQSMFEEKVKEHSQDIMTQLTL